MRSHQIMTERNAKADGQFVETVKDTRRFSDGDEARLQAMGQEEARAHLVSYRGVGEKVADCICLYGLGHKDAFPVDVWVRRILASHYPQGFPQRTSRFAGVYQQVMFEYERGMADE